MSRATSIYIRNCAVKDCPNTAVRRIDNIPFCEECGLEHENDPIAVIRIALDDALTRRDAEEAGKLSNVLRFKHGMNYKQQVEIAVSLGHTEDLWEELMYESDRSEIWY